MENTTFGELFVVSTPIGNLSDMTFRAVETLKKVNCVLCEDTRTSRKLLQRYEITTPLLSFHSYSTPQKLISIIERLLKGESLALISDAGTPGISDPAFQLTQEAVKQGIKIVPIPGASAFLTALQASGVPINQFIYLGFLPVKKGRKTIFESLQKEEKTIVFYESVHRIQKTLEECSGYFGKDRLIVVARELTKLHEEFFRGTCEEAVKHFKAPKGEFVIIIPAKER